MPDVRVAFRQHLVGGAHLSVLQDQIGLAHGRSTALVIRPNDRMAYVARTVLAPCKVVAP
jgi:hypothetical protein